uniref:Atx10homo_assoc domain-containing protein n=1 Tax=Mesocestoides corti TaxID=53468 RepID=A0A5K3FNZ3_MESCO
MQTPNASRPSLRPFYLPPKKQPSSAEIVRECRDWLHTVGTKRPYTPREANRSLFSNKNLPKSRPVTAETIESSEHDEEACDRGRDVAADENNLGSAFIDVAKDRGPQIRRPPTKPEAHSGSQVSPKVRTSRCKPPLLSPLKSEIRGLSKSPPGRSPASILTRRAVEKKRDSEVRGLCLTVTAMNRD